ncbi:hypothetical protein Tco_0405543 [Tanacetum coccineum]
MENPLCKKNFYKSGHTTPGGACFKRRKELSLEHNMMCMIHGQRQPSRNISIASSLAPGAKDSIKNQDLLLDDKPFAKDTGVGNNPQTSSQQISIDFILHGLEKHHSSVNSRFEVFRSAFERVNTMDCRVDWILSSGAGVPDDKNQ